MVPKDEDSELNHYCQKPTGNKRCSNCRKLLPKTEFHKNKARYDGLTNYCKSCASNQSKELYKGSRRLKIQYNAMSKRALRQVTPFHITFEEFSDWDDSLGDVTSRICPYCGLTEEESKAFQRLRGKSRLCGFTVDRTDNTRGYSIENIQRICFLCNMIKGLWFTNEEMKEIGQLTQKIQKKHLIEK
jgi:hypothetical protein